MVENMLNEWLPLIGVDYVREILTASWCNASTSLILLTLHLFNSTLSTKFHLESVPNFLLPIQLCSNFS